MTAQLNDYLSLSPVPLFIVIVLLAAWCRGVKIYEVFIEGAGEGLQTVVKITPYLIAMLAAVNLLRESGLLERLIGLSAPLLRWSGVPPELTPLLVMRPLSGTGSIGMVSDILARYGADSPLGLIASVIMGSTDTTFYILTVYFGAAGITRTRYAALVGLAGDIIGFMAAVYLCRRLFDLPL